MFRITTAIRQDGAVTSVTSSASAISASTTARISNPFGADKAIHAQARSLPQQLEPISHALSHGRYQSPLRYPGAKSSLSPVIARIITSAKQSREVPEVNLLVEPFAGGASASLRAIGEGVADRILLADADPLVTSFWQAAADDTEQLIDRMYGEWNRYIRNGGVSGVERWDYWRVWAPRPEMDSRDRRMSVAMQCLFLNRTTFSGILHGKAGPIGGRAQASAYPIGCRWNPDALAERIRYVGHLYTIGRLVDVWCKDWRQTLEDVPEQYPQLLPSRVVAYLDPPYIEKSSLLYRTSFDPHGGYGSNGRTSDTRPGIDTLHLDLAGYLRTKAQFRWLLSYDNYPLLMQSKWLYGQSRMAPTDIDRETLGVRQWRISKRLVATRYSAGGRSGKKSAEELLITTLPPSTVPVDDQLRLP